MGMRAMLMKYIILLSILAALIGMTHYTAVANEVSVMGAQERYTQTGKLRYLLLLPDKYDFSKKYEMWLNIHGSPGCAEHAIYQYRLEAKKRNVILLAPQGTGDKDGEYIREFDHKKAYYRFIDMKTDRDHILIILDEVERKFSIDKNRVALLGFSAGCEMGWRLLAARPDTFYFFGGVANGFRHGVPPGGESGLRKAAAHVPHFYAAGKDDDFSRPMFKSTAVKLKQYGFELKTLYVPGVGHDLPPSIQLPLLAYMDQVRKRANFKSNSHLGAAVIPNLTR